MHDTVKLLETIDGFYLRIRRHCRMTETEKVSSTVTKKMKSLKLPERLGNLSITYSDVGHAG